MIDYIIVFWTVCMIFLHNVLHYCKSNSTRRPHTVSSWPIWSTVLHIYSVTAQADLEGLPWCRMMPTFVPVPQPSYSQARENLVRAIPPKLLCLLACGGIDCRYEGPECWKLNQQVIRGLFSSWWVYVTAVSYSLVCYVQLFTVYELLHIAGWRMTLLPWLDHPII